MFVITLTYGLMIGQACLAVCIAGVFGRRWMTGLGLATILCILALALILLGRFIVSPFFIWIDTGVLWAGFNVPLILLAAAIPFFALRFFWGIHLTRSLAPRSTPRKGLEDFLVVISMVAALLFLTRIPQVAWEIDSATYWASVATIMALLAVFSLVGVFPLFCIQFLIKSRKTRIIALGCLAALAFSMTHFFSGFFISPAPRDWSTGIAFGILPISMIYLGLLTLQWSGYQLHRKSSSPLTPTNDLSGSERPSTSSPADPFEDHADAEYDPSPAADNATTINRWTIAVVLSLAVLAGVVVNLVENQRTSQLKQNVVLANQLASHAGALRAEKRNVVHLSLGVNATNEAFADLPGLTSVQSLDLSDTEIDDSALENLKRYPSLQALNVSRTNISAEALLQFAPQNLVTLKIAGTKLTVDDVNNYLRRRASNALPMYLDVSDMNWTIEDILKLELDRIQYLALRNYDLTDDQLSQVLASPGPNLSGLDLRDNQLTGKSLGALSNLAPAFVRLLIDDNPITDANFSSSFKKPPVRFLFLSLSGTQLTNASLPILVGIYSEEMVIGEGLIDDQGIAQAPLGCSIIHLNARQFTGTPFEKWPSGSFPQIDVSRSGVSDATLPAILATNCRSLDLSHTSITDESLIRLGQATFTAEVDLSHTGVTIEGLLRGDLAHCARVIIAPDQFSAEEILKLSEILNLEVGGALHPIADSYLER